MDFKTYPNSIFQVWTLKWIMELSECSCIVNKLYVTWEQTEPLSSFSTPVSGSEFTLKH